MSIVSASSVAKLAGNVYNSIDELIDFEKDTIETYLTKMSKFQNNVNKYIQGKYQVYPPSKSASEFFTSFDVSRYDEFDNEYKNVINQARNNHESIYPSIKIIDRLPPFNIIIDLNKNLDGLLDNSSFIYSLYSIIWDCIRYYGHGHLSTIGFTKFLINQVNEKTRPDYIVNKCFSQKNYTCGRALEKVTEPGKNTRLVIFGTVSMDDDYMDDQDYENRIIPTLTNKYLSNNNNDDKNKYYAKYLKYKSKYLELKNKL